MRPVRRVVFDTSTLVSAALRIGSTPYRALISAFRVCELCASVATLAELEEVLSRSKFDRYVNREERLGFLTVIRRNVHLYEVHDSAEAIFDPPCRDLNDNKILAVAQSAEADAIVSSDDDLLVLDPWRGIPVMAPARFLEWLEQDFAVSQG